jgi:hypothetical protein
VADLGPRDLQFLRGRLIGSGGSGGTTRSVGRVLSVAIPRVIHMGVRLRILEDADLDQLFKWERDPHAVAMAAFTRANPSDRAAFDGHYQRIRSDPDVTLRAIDDEGALAGMIASFTTEGEREVSYWIDPSRMGSRACIGGPRCVGSGRGDEAAVRTRRRTQHRLCQGAHSGGIRAGRLREIEVPILKSWPALMPTR